MKRLIPLIAAVFCCGLVAARTVHFDFDDSEADVEFFPGITANASIDLATHGRVLVDTDLWLEVSAQADGSATSAHVNDGGLGVEGGNGSNQIGTNETLVFNFYDAATGGNPVEVELGTIWWDNFADEGDGAVVSTGDLLDITVDGDVNAPSTGYNYSPYTLSFDVDAVTVSTFSIWGDSATSTAGGRVNAIQFFQTGDRPRPPPPVTPNPDAPNIVYIIVDDMGYSDLGCFGGEIDTPEIDRLAEEGIRFRQHYTHAKCETSRTSMLTGMYYEKCGLKIQRNTGALTVGEILGAANYHTGIAGKWHMENPKDGMGVQHPLDRGFDFFYGILGGSSFFYNPGDVIYSNRTLLPQSQLPPNFYSTDAFAENGRIFIQSVYDENNADADPTNDRPFFLYLAFTAPHEPLQAPSALIAKYRNSYSSGWDRVRQARYQRQLELGIVEPEWPLSQKPDHLPEWDSLPANIQDMEDLRMAIYAAMIERVDYQVGLLVDQLEALGIRNNTLVYFVSDNGASPYGALAQDYSTTMGYDENGQTAGKRLRSGEPWAWMSNTPFRYYKQNQYNGGICTPMIVSWPDGITQTNAISDLPTHIMDAVPTMADLAGVDLALHFPDVPSFDGVSLVDYFADEIEPARPDGLGFEFQAMDYAYIDYPWKIVSYRQRPWALYDLQADRTEVNNLAIFDPVRVAEMTLDYQNWMAERDKDSPAPSSIFSGMEPATSIYKDLVEYRNPLTGDVYSPTDPQFSVNTIGTVNNLTIDTDQTADGRWTATMDALRIGNASDDFVLVSKEVNGDGYVSAKITELTTGGPNRRAGVMVRESTTDNAAFVMLEVNYNDGSPMVQFRTRETTGATALLGDHTSVSLPVWLRVNRKLNTFEGFYSQDGRTWLSTGSIQQTMNRVAHTGVALCPQTTSGTGTITFSEPFVYAIREFPRMDSDQNGSADLIDFSSGRQGFGLSLDPITDGAGLSLSYRRLADPAELSFSFEESENMKDWFPSAWVFDSSETTSVPDVNKFIYRPESPPTVSNMFYRLLVE